MNGGRSGETRSCGRSAIFCSPTLACWRLQNRQFLIVVLAREFVESIQYWPLWLTPHAVQTKPLGLLMDVTEQNSGDVGIFWDDMGCFSSTGRTVLRNRPPTLENYSPELDPSLWLSFLWHSSYLPSRGKILLWSVAFAHSILLLSLLLPSHPLRHGALSVNLSSCSVQYVPNSLQYVPNSLASLKWRSCAILILLKLTGFMDRATWKVDSWFKSDNHLL